MVAYKFKFTYCDIEFRAVRYEGTDSSKLELYQVNAHGLEVFISYACTSGQLGTAAYKAEECYKALLGARKNCALEGVSDAD